MVISMSRKQKINTRSSTEAELVAVDEAIGSVLWTKRFLEAQGLTTGKCTVYQDNKSAILLETNGQRSSGKRTKHIDVCYFFVKDRVEHGDLVIKHCPAATMWGDYFTKPKQGRDFKTFQQRVMNHGSTI